MHYKRAKNSLFLRLKEEGSSFKSYHTVDTQVWHILRLGISKFTL